MTRFHVHVYNVTSKAELDVNADSAPLALAKASEAAEAGLITFGESDCKKLAIIVDEQTSKLVANDGARERRNEV